MNEQDRTPGSEEPPVSKSDVGNEGVPIPSRIREAVDQIKRRATAEIQRERDVVREYEERYYRTRSDRQSRLESTPDEAEEIPVGYHRGRKAKRHVFPANVDENERKWAALAHASTLLTALVALGSGGAGVLVTLLVPLFIYFSFRKRSEFVAFHALQAFTIQLVGTIGFLALLVTGLIIWVALLIISALLILVLVGIILLPLVVLLFPVFFLASLALPIGMVIYSVIAMVETWGGNNYRLPYVARWVENQMYGGPRVF